MYDYHLHILYANICFYLLVKCAYQQLTVGFDMRYSASIDIKVIFPVVTRSIAYGYECVFNL